MLVHTSNASKPPEQDQANPWSQELYQDSSVNGRTAGVWTITCCFSGAYTGKWIKNQRHDSVSETLRWDEGILIHHIH